MKLLKILGPVLVLALGVGFMAWMLSTAPEAKKREKKASPLVVEVVAVHARDYPVTIRSFGEVKARTETTITAEVAGKIVETGPHFNEGDYVRKGELLARIDDRDYRSAVTIARADLAAQQVKLEQEQARSRQALIDWRELGRGGKPSDLVLRKPQLASARAAVDSARARLMQAKTNLERASIRAPYDGCILEKLADVGQFVSRGTRIARVFATDYVEISLPLTDRQLALVDLPEQYRDAAPRPGPPVVLRANGSRWRGRITRTAAAVDPKSRQQHVIARVDDPYGRVDGARAPLKIGLYVEAEIEGRTLRDAIVIPRAALRENDTVFLAVDGHLKRRTVKVTWTDKDEAVIGEGLKSGDQLIVSPMPYAADGAEITVGKPAKDPT